MEVTSTKVNLKAIWGIGINTKKLKHLGGNIYQQVLSIYIFTL